MRSMELVGRERREVAVCLPSPEITYASGPGLLTLLQSTETTLDLGRGV